MRIQSFGTRGLFGIFDHDIVLNTEERLTIIHGPNGFGKTTLLRLLRDFFQGKLDELTTTPLSSFYINLDNQKTVTVTKVLSAADTTQEAHCVVSLTEPSGEMQVHTLVIQNYDRYVSTEIGKRAPYVQRIGQDLWEDTRDGELLDSDELAERYRLNRISSKERNPYPEWLSEIVRSVDVRLIETQRLILEKKPIRHGISRTQARTTATVIEYAQQLAGKIQAIFNDYARLSQQLDRTFVVRLLKRDFAVQEASPSNSVSAKVENLNEKRRRLRDSGLLSKEDEALPSPEAPNHIIDQILNAYLQDVESKLAVFDTLLERIELLTKIVDAHLEYKKLIISREFGIQFRATYDNHKRILPASLSSGEQHMLILFYDLLFNESENSLILIDEPEISLHVEWQLSFLADLRNIVSLVPHDIVLATHSPQIINNHWELTVPLNRPEDAEI
jgi:predicted ATP-binding protein involved in virulence